ncbi:MAG: glycosyltransferase [Armatimonadetes bacterium]|nr:glycosyltransferase [Armatimonadota bacterium]NIM23293.1 glycosyltransferase [Armatimonadota bacterium]NIM67157.1 glycosyltransferase [Armatimonadota bacterium]NIM75684.1 glycosyltransferase [Armatimonadota bacterium]NIN05346.1 glycosyltransferase [Armatimonadota bacterium]
MPALSAVVCARNESEKIEECLRSLRWADEVVLLDMQSTDATVERARPWADRVISIPPVPVVEMVRDRMLQEASHDWVLIVDPDERIPHALALRLRELLGSTQTFAALRIPRRNFLLNHPMRAAGWYPDPQVRLLNKHKARWPAAVHSVPQVEGVILDLPCGDGAEILHYNYSSLSEFLHKMNRYTDAHARALREEGSRFRWYKLFYHPLKEIWLRYISRRGYRDGLPGLVFTLLMGIYYLVLYAKLWELERAANILDQPISDSQKSMPLESRIPSSSVEGDLQP